jgi:hypothetical protein
MKIIFPILLSFLVSTAQASNVDICRFDFMDLDEGQKYTGSFTFEETSIGQFEISYDVMSPYEAHGKTAKGYLTEMPFDDYNDFKKFCPELEQKYNVKFCEQVERVQVISSDEGDATHLFRTLDKDGNVLVRFIAPDLFLYAICL